MGLGFWLKVWKYHIQLYSFCYEAISLQEIRLRCWLIRVYYDEFAELRQFLLFTKRIIFLFLLLVTEIIILLLVSIFLLQHLLFVPWMCRFYSLKQCKLMGRSGKDDSQRTGKLLCGQNSKRLQQFLFAASRCSWATH